MLELNSIRRNLILRKQPRDSSPNLNQSSTGVVSIIGDTFMCCKDPIPTYNLSPTPEGIQREVKRIRDLEEIEIKIPTLVSFIEDAKTSLNSAEVHLPGFELEARTNDNYKEVIEHFKKKIKVLPSVIKILERLSSENKRELSPMRLEEIIKEEIKKQKEILLSLKRDETRNKEEISTTTEITSYLEKYVKTILEYQTLVNGLHERARRNLLMSPEERKRDLEASLLLTRLKKNDYARYTLIINKEDATLYIQPTEQLQKTYQLVRKSPRLGRKMLKFLQLVEKLEKITGEKQARFEIEKFIINGDTERLEKRLNELIEDLATQGEVELKISKHTIRFNKKNSSDEKLTLVRKDLDKLFSSNAEIKNLAKRIEKNPSPENIIAFVAFVEKNSDFLKYDLPGWEGNNYYNGVVIDNKKCFQGGCVAEATVTGFMLEYLKEKDILPKTSTFYNTYMGLHWALGVFRDKYDGGFIIDRWISEPGAIAPTFSTYKDWTTAANLFMDNERKVREEQEALFSFCTLRKEFGIREDCIFLEEWSKKNKVSWYRAYIYISSRENRNIGQAQDLIIFRYFLGENPLLPKDFITPQFFDGVKIKVAHILDKYGIASKDEILKCKDLKELEKYLKLYFVHFYTGSDAVRRIYPDWEKITKENPTNKKPSY